MKKRIMTAGMLAMILAIGMTACTKADNTTKTEKTSESDGKKEPGRTGQKQLIFKKQYDIVIIEQKGELKK